MGMHFTACAPKHLWPNEKLIETCKEIAQSTGATITLTEDPDQGAKQVDVLYTDVWVSMGEPKEVWASRIDELHPYQVNERLMRLAQKNAIFMHCLPAFHGTDTEVGKEIASTFGQLYPNLVEGSLEVTDEVIESKQSVVFDEAENRMHTIKAVMYASLGGPNV